MVEKVPVVNPGFNQEYFSSAAYAGVSFDRYSQYWWSNRYYAKLVRKYGPGSGRVLEIGCGLGHLLGWLADNYELYGTDINPWALVEATRNVPEGRFLYLSAEDLKPFPNRAFQVVIAKHVVEHLSAPERAIAEIGRVLAPGGLLLLATPNTTSLTRAIKKDDWIGYQDPTHINLFPPEKWLGTIRTHDIQPIKVYSDGFWDAPYVNWLPTPIQKILFGAPGGIQAVFGWSVIPLRLGESLIVIAKKS